MKKKYLVLVIFVLSLSMNAQINWANDLLSAKAMALEQGKLIVLDFTATWCGPCKIMDKNLWESPKMKEFAKNAVFLKVDIDINGPLANKYRVTSIPNIKIVTVKGDVVWEQKGYSGNDKPYYNVLKNIPTDVRSLNNELLPFVQNRKEEANIFELAKIYQTLAASSKGRKIKKAFISLSNNHFKKTKKNKDGNYKESELRLVLNMAYMGNHKKALSKLEKISLDESDDNLQEIRKIIKGVCAS